MTKIPKQIAHLMNKIIKNYLEALPAIQWLLRLTKSVQGKDSDQYVFQLSYGTQ